ncbi:hypothetical protein ACWKYK_06030, partial [Enterobacter hormaechei]
SAIDASYRRTVAIKSVSRGHATELTNHKAAAAIGIAHAIGQVAAYHTKSGLRYAKATFRETKEVVHKAPGYSVISSPIFGQGQNYCSALFIGDCEFI